MAEKQSVGGICGTGLQLEPPRGADGLALGVLHQQYHNREKARDDSRRRQTRALEEKESSRWIQILEKSAADLPGTARAVTVCDREGDLYELLDTAERLGQPFLIRVAQNRMTVDTVYQKKRWHYTTFLILNVQLPVRVFCVGFKHPKPIPGNRPSIHAETRSELGKVRRNFLQVAFACRLRGNL